MLLWKSGEAAPKNRSGGLLRWDPWTAQDAVRVAHPRGGDGLIGGTSSAASAYTVSAAEVAPLREGFAMNSGGAPSVRSGNDKEGDPPPKALDLVDTKQVRRSKAPVIKKHVKASMAQARAALASRQSVGRALAELDGDTYANSSVAPRNSRWKTLVTLASGAGDAFKVLPLTRSKLRLLGASLKAGSYKSGAEYLRVAKARHLQAGHCWDTVLQATLADVSRSMTRGVGAPERAMAFGLVELAHLGRGRKGAHTEGPVNPVAVGICMALWLLRGLEAASLLGEQASISSKRDYATLNLGPTKSDVRGKGCLRTLACACDDRRMHADNPRALCPVAALEEICRTRCAMGLGGKDPLFPRGSGKATTARGVCSEMAALTGIEVTEHSFRRVGAKFYAARGVTEPHICYLGRWGSAVVRSYIEEAWPRRILGGIPWRPLRSRTWDLTGCVRCCLRQARLESLTSRANENAF